MAVVAYSPIARGNAKNGDVLARIGEEHGKSAAQVCLRFLVQQQIVVIPRTSRLERLSENAAIFDFELSRRRDGNEIAGDGAVQLSGSPMGSMMRIRLDVAGTWD